MYSGIRHDPFALFSLLLFLLSLWGGICFFFAFACLTLNVTTYWSISLSLLFTPLRQLHFHHNLIIPLQWNKTKKKENLSWQWKTVAYGIVDCFEIRINLWKLAEFWWFTIKLIIFIRFGFRITDTISNWNSSNYIEKFIILQTDFFAYFSIWKIILIILRNFFFGSHSIGFIEFLLHFLKSRIIQFLKSIEACRPFSQITMANNRRWKKKCQNLKSKQITNSSQINQKRKCDNKPSVSRWNEYQKWKRNNQQ